MKSQVTNLPIEVAEEKTMELAIIDKTKRRYNRALAEAKALAQFGIKTYRIKARTQAALGDVAQKLGAKKLGHGKIMVASENAEEVISRIQDYIEELRASDPPCDPKVIIDLMHLLRDFNKQLLETGQSHIDADRATAGLVETANLNIPFPAGTPMVVAIKTGTPQNSIEPPEPND
jgi:hypothetical protein